MVTVMRSTLRNMMLLAIAGLLLMLTGCAALQARLEGVPVWTIEKPSNNLTKVFFVGEGESDMLNEMAAREQAYEDILVGLSDFLGFNVTETYRRELIQTQQIEQIELQITEEFVKERDGRITMFVLAEASRRGVTPLVRSNESENRAEESKISVPESEAVNAYRKQDDFQAFTLYIEAALEAYRSSLSDGKERYAQLMSRAAEVLEGIQVTKEDSETSSGVFTAKITRGTGVFSPRLGGVPVRVTFPVQNQIGVTRQETLTARSDSRGNVTFRPKPTIFRGSGTLMMYLDITDELSLLIDQVGVTDAHVVELRSIISEKKLEYPYAIVSESAGSNLVTALLEYDRNGSLLNESSALTALNTSLTQAGFETNALSLEEQLESEDALLARMQAVFPQGIRMAVIGSVGISSVTTLEQSHIVAVRGSLRAYLLDSGNVYTQSGDLAASGSGTTVEAARRAAFSRFGQIAASVIAGKLL
jgi:hypothetical protein